MSVSHVVSKFWPANTRKIRKPNKGRKLGWQKREQKIHIITHNLGMIYKVLYIMYRLCVIKWCWKHNTSNSSSTILSSWNPKTLRTHNCKRLVPNHKWPYWEFGWLSPNCHCLPLHMILTLSLKCSNTYLFSAATFSILLTSSTYFVSSHFGSD